MKPLIIIPLVFVIALLCITRLAAGYWIFFQEDPVKVEIRNWAAECSKAGGTLDIMVGCIDNKVLITTK